MKLGKALKMGLAKSIQINDTSEYTIAGVQSYGKGVINRRNEIGKNLKMKKYQVIEPDYLMWCKVDTKNGAFGITKEEHRGSLASTNMALAKIDTEKFNPSFIEKLFSFDFFHKNITHLSSGSTNRKYLTPKQLFEMVEIPAINKNEQDDFILLVDKIERIDLNSELTHQLDLIKQLRQAFLREAMQGKLCHAELVSASQETGHDLLAKIKAEKAQLIAEKKLKKEKELPSITEDEIPFEIPEHWAWCRLGEIISYTENLDIHKKLTSDTEINYVDIASIDNKEYIIKEIKKSKVSELSTRARRVLKKGYIIYSTVRPYLKNIAIINQDLPNFIGSTGFNVFKPIVSDVNFLFYFLLTPDLNKRYEEMMVGFNSPSITNEQFENTLFPLPPLHEQEQIVAKLEELMAFCDGLEQSIKESQGYNEKLLQQVLREALKPH